MADPGPNRRRNDHDHRHDPVGGRGRGRARPQQPQQPPTYRWNLSTPYGLSLAGVNVQQLFANNAAQNNRPGPNLVANRAPPPPPQLPRVLRPPIIVQSPQVA